MADDTTPLLIDRVDDRAALGALAHRMNNALAYLITNLNLLNEEIEAAPGEGIDRDRALQLVVSAGTGADQVRDLVRQLKVLSWGRPDEPLGEHDDDTWDTGVTARILVVDDEPQILSAVARSLSRHEVAVASSGRQARAHLEAGEDFDVLLCDVMMPDTSGIELYRWIRERRPELIDRLVFMTAGAFTREVRQFLSSVPNTVLHKPFDTKTLRWIVGQRVRGQA